MKGKSVVTAPIIKGNLGANLSGLGRNIILTTMPAGTKLIAGNKPVSFLTAQQLQQLQQQGQATQVRSNADCGPAQACLFSFRN